MPIPCIWKKHRSLALALLLFTVSRCWAAPYPKSQTITGMRLDWATHQRFAQGSDNFQLTWADDNHLYGAWGDGGGFGGTNQTGRVGLGVARIEGDPTDYRGFNVWGGHNAENTATFDGKSWGMICVDGTLYMWVVPDKPPGKPYRNHYEYVELARSQDRAATWKKGGWKFVESENLTIPTFLSFGRDYSGVPGPWKDYVYSYFIRPRSPTVEQQGPHGVGLVVHQPGAIYLARVPQRSLLGPKSMFQFYGGRDARGEPRWGDLSQKRPVFEDAQGVGWCLSACYLPALQRIVLCTEHDASSQGTLGIFDAPTPWGPWTTVEYYDRATPFGASRPGSGLPWRSNVFFAAFATKWLDGARFTLNFTGAGQGKDNDSFNTVSGSFMVRGRGEE